MGPRDLQSKTWFLNKTWLRTSNHFPVVVKIEGKELSAKKGKKGWAGWVPKPEDEKLEFQELTLHPGDVCDWTGEDGTEGLLALQTSGRKKSESIAEYVSTIQLRRRKNRPKGSVTREDVEMV